MTKINRQDVLHIAGLSRIGVAEKELEKYSDEVIKILEYVKVLDEVNVEDCEPVYSVGKNTSVMRQDNKQICIDREVILNNASRRDLVNIRTKGVFNE